MKKVWGMTLIELTVVMLLIMMAASLTLPLFTGIAQNTRNQITEARVTQIKQAIINVQTVNGTPTVSGFVADVGRLPYCIQELINQTCNNVPTNVPPIANSWKGPYLQTSDGTFYDGWGNSNTLGDGNFGWFYSRYSQTYQSSLPAILTPCTTASPTVTVSAGVQGVCDTLTLQSYGADGFSDSAVGATAYVAGSYDADYPASLSIPSWPTPPNLISPSDWIVDLSTTGLNVQFNHPPPSALFPTISTACTPAATATYSGTTFTQCPTTGTTAATTTITCPQPNTTVVLSTPIVSGASVIFTCVLNPVTPGSVSITNPITATFTKTDGTLTLSNVPGIATTPGVETVTITGATSSTITSSITSNYSLCPSFAPVTPLILANDLYGNSVIPTPLPVGAPGSLPSNNCLIPNTVNYNDSTATVVPSSTPMAVGNWNICAFQASPSTPAPTLSSGGVIQATIPTVTPYASPAFPQTLPLSTSCLNTVETAAYVPSVLLSYSPALYSATITVLPRTQPSIAW